MHGVLLASPEVPVPPRLYGGTERNIDLLARGLADRGHHVTLFAHPDSRVTADLRPWRGTRSESRLATVLNAAHLGAFLSRRRADTVVHSFARLAYLAFVLPLPIPKLHTYQREIGHRPVRWGHALSRGSLLFTACTAHCIPKGRGLGSWEVIPNGVDLTAYTFVAQVPQDAPLVFLGRVEPIKGVHHAIDVALRAGRRLVIAGNVPRNGPHRAYAEGIVARCDGHQVEYVGPVDDVQKNRLLGEAAALLFPIEWEEPFGMVMTEAMACGTPVIALRRGSVPEVIDDGQTGFVCEGADAMIDSVARLPELSRAQCRLAVEEQFSADVVVERCLELYQRVARQIADRS